MDAADAALAEAWRLSVEDHTEEVETKFEQLLPILIEAGYAEATERIWSFTPRGVDRAESLVEDPPEN